MPEPIIDKSGNESPMQDNSEMITLKVPKASADALKQVLKDLSDAIDQAEGTNQPVAQSDTDSGQELSQSQEMQKEIEAMSKGGLR